MKKILLALLSLMSVTSLGFAAPVKVEKSYSDYPVKPVPFTEAKVSGGFWAPRLETHRTATIPHCFKECEETGRMDNFAIAGGLKQGKFKGYYFNDSDVYKVIEGAAYSLAIRPDPELDKYLDAVIAQIAAAQEKDGYLYTARTAMGQGYTPPGGKERWSDMAGGHELYCVGHLYEAAVAHYRATGKRTLLNVALKNADLVCNVFGPGKRLDPCGHQEIEIGLVKLFRVTGDEKYLKQATFFLDERGNPNRKRHYGAYAQDHKPVVEQDEAVGHAVRAQYMYTAMADVAAATGDPAYMQALDKIWKNVVGKKLYVTGGIGAAGGHEGFAGDYELPNLTAYCETCASIANIFWNHRMFLLTGDADCMDVLERTLYNAMLSGISLDGKTFFYPNPLESDGRQGRSPWFGCACCPSNVARFIPAVPGYAYAHRDDQLYVNLFIAGEAKVKLADQTVTIKQETRYPWDGAVKMVVEPEKAKETFEIRIRIPGWARNQPVASDLYRFMDKNDGQPTLKINGQSQSLDLANGYARIRRAWEKGDVIELNLPMPVRRVVSHDKVKADVGKVALQRGPIVYCIEWPDVEDGHVANLLLADGERISSEYRDNLLSGVEVLRGKAQSFSWGKNRELKKGKDIVFTAIPYYAWAHRGGGEMAVWLARTEAAVRPLPAPTIASTARARASGGDGKALNDQREPKSSDDHSNRFLHWWPRKGTQEWVQYDFKEPTTVSAVEIYWFDDTGIGECRLPKSWRLLYKDGDEWKPVRNPSGFGCEGNKYNRTTFDPVKTGGLRIEVQLPEKFSAGIHEWRVE